MNSVNIAIQAIRNIDELSCEDLAAILAALGCKMVTTGFSDLDVQFLDEARDAICGEVA